MRDVGYSIFNDLNLSIGSALHKDLSEKEWHDFNPKTKDWTGKIKKSRPGLYDIEKVEIWQQTYGSTAGPFGGMGGAAMTTLNIVLLSVNGEVALYAGGRFMYKLTPNQLFWEDVKNRKIANKSEEYLK